MPLNTVKLSPEILREMVSHFIASQEEVTDLNESSTIYEIFYIFSLALQDLNLKLNLNINDITIGLANSLFGFERNTGEYASGVVTFTLDESKKKPFIIPQNTVIYSSAGNEYRTTQTLIIPTGNKTGDTPATAINIGVINNAEIDTVNNLGSSIEAIEKVSNALPFTGGKNSETDEEYILRFKNYIKSLGSSNIFYYENASKGVEGVRDALLKNLVPAQNIAGQLYNMIIYIDDGAATASNELIKKVKTAISGDDSNENPGIISGGLACYIVAAQKKSIEIETDIITDGLMSLTTLENQLKSTIAGYVNDLKIGKNLYISDIISILKEQNHILDVIVKKPTKNITVNKDQVAKLDKIEMNLSIATEND